MTTRLPTVRPNDSTPAGDAPRVLAVDDDPGLRLVMEETLEKAGFVVRCASSGREAVDGCAGFVPDLVLLDINMPAMDGIEACAAIHRITDAPIVMVTSVDDAESIQRAFAAGATDFIIKPINWPLFQRRLDAVLAEWEHSRELDAQTRRLGMLERVVPDQVMLLSRRAEILEDLRSDTGNDAPATVEELYGEDIAARFRQRISGVLKTGRHANLGFSVDGPSGRIEFEAQFLVEGRDRIIVVVQNATRAQRSQDELYALAYIDPLTSLPNRHQFDRSAEQCLVDSRLRGRSLAVFSLCFDALRGPEGGDRDLVRLVAERLAACLAEATGILDIGTSKLASPVASVDRNVFMFLLTPADDDAVEDVCERISRSLSGRIETDGGVVSVSPTLGLATFPADGDDLASLTRAAEAAMREALHTGQRIQKNSPAANDHRVETRDSGDELKSAIEQDALELYYQPRVSASDRRITGVEALLRWNHPMRGFVDTDELLGLAMSTGVIGAMGEWVLERALSDIKSWGRDAPPRLAINLSRQELLRQNFIERLGSAIAQAGFDASRLDLELTEAALVQSSPQELAALKALGLRLVVDDFGTGHSSLAMLKACPVDALKIDRSFVAGLGSDERDAAICKVIVTTAHLLGMTAIAEGVETDEQFDALSALGCDEIQGYVLSRPLPAAETDRFLRDYRA